MILDRARAIDNPERSPSEGQNVIGNPTFEDFVITSWILPTALVVDQQRLGRRSRFQHSMANTTDPTALNVHGTNPQFLIEKILREKIRDSPYWKEHCFALTAETILVLLAVSCLRGSRC